MEQKEISANYARVIDMDVKRGAVSIKKPSSDAQEAPREFTFDAVYDWK
jgi:hypothetical protein